jgi:hypothetical protein
MFPTVANYCGHMREQCGGYIFFGSDCSLLGIYGVVHSAVFVGAFKFNRPQFFRMWTWDHRFNTNATDILVRMFGQSPAVRA